MNEDSVGILSCASWDIGYREKFERNEEPKLIHVGRTKI